MSNILAQIVADKREVIERMKEDFPLDSFVVGVSPSVRRSLYDTLSEENAGYILECKKASPSKGLIREDFDAVEIAKVYEKYAAGISVLTDEKYFKGKYEYLQAVCKAVDVPVLNKDFFFDTYQVHLARYYGADAILLMLSVLNDDEYKELAEVAKSYNMAILTEISNNEELERAIALDAKLIGINNRNLRDLSTDISRTFHFAPKIPDDRIVISESGIYTNAQVRELAPAVDGFLVGSSIMAKDDIDLACRTLIFGQNKVCGLTSSSAATAAKNSGAVYGGLIFAQKSPRFVSIEQAQEIVATESGINYVGVFVNADINQVAEYAEKLGLFAVQLHGRENDNFIERLQAKLPSSCQIWQAQSVRDKVAPLSDKVSYHVLDGATPGSGQAYNWRALADTEQDLSTSFLAGGIGEENIENSIEVQNVQKLFGLDINSGVESAPGVKCEKKLTKVFAKIRRY